MPSLCATIFLAAQHSMRRCSNSRQDGTDGRQRPGNRLCSGGGVGCAGNFRALQGASPRAASGRSRGHKGRMVPRVGFEPTAYRLRSGCSTTELSGLALAFGRVPIATEIGPVQVLSAPAGRAGRPCGRAAERLDSGSFQRLRQAAFRQQDQGVIPTSALRSKSRLHAVCLRLECRHGQGWNAGAPSSLAVLVPTPGSPPCLDGC